MASLITGKGQLVLTSGLKFWPAPITSSSSSSSHSLQDVPFRAITIPDPLPPTDGKSIQPQPESSDPLTILCGRFSPDGSVLALCDDHKQMTIWNTQDWTLKRQLTLARRANQVVFHTNDIVFIADKSGDIYELDLTSTTLGDEKNPFGKVILGHLSMVLDVKMSECGHFILTSDRDEKIRITHYPNSYNIHGFCLGHEEFVSSMSLMPDKRLLSASGDGTIKIWKYLQGEEICSKLCHPDAGMDLVEVTEMNGDKKKIPPAVRQALFHQFEGHAIITVALNQYKGILVYKFDAERETLDFVQAVKTADEIWNHAHLENGTLCILQRGQEEPLLGFQFQEGKFVPDPAFTLTPNPERDQFIQASSSCSNGLDELYKRWFDNVKDYLQRKEQRIISKKQSNKKPKLQS